MSVCSILNKHLQFSSSKIKKIIGTDSDDNIDLTCKSDEVCTLQINDKNCTFSSDMLNTFAYIDGLKGNDTFNINIAKSIYTVIKLDASQGNNSIDCQVHFPHSAGIIYLGTGANDIYIDKNKGSELLINGFRNIEGNKIHIKNSQGTKLNDMEIELIDPAADTYDISIEGVKMFQILNNYSLHEEQLVLEARAAELVGNPIPKAFIELGIPLHSAPELTQSLLETHVVFE